MKTRILNSIVSNAADIMEAQIDVNQKLIEELCIAGTGCPSTQRQVGLLRDENRRIYEAVTLIRARGSWV